MPLNEFKNAADKFFNPTDRDLEVLLKTNYPLQVRSLFVEKNFRIIREIMPELIVSVIYLGTDWLITSVQSTQFRKKEPVKPSKNRDDLTDTSALLVSVINNVNILANSSDPDDRLVQDTRALLDQYKPDGFHFDIRGCFQLIFNTVVLYADKIKGINSKTVSGFNVFTEEHRDHLTILKELVGIFCMSYHIAQKLPASKANSSDFRDEFHTIIESSKYVLSAYNPVQRIESKYPKPKALWQEKLSSSIREYLDSYDWSIYQDNPQEFIEGLLVAAQVGRVSDPVIDHQKTNLLVMTPKPKEGKKHMNTIQWYDGQGKQYMVKNVGNDVFDFIYYLAWLKQKGSKGIIHDKDVPQDHINEIIPDSNSRIYLQRFMTKWAEGDSEQKAKKKSTANSLMGHEIVEKSGVHYKLAECVSIELHNYPEV